MIPALPALMALPLLGASALAAADQAPGSRPHVVIIIADDLTWHDVACFGGPTSARTPNLDRLALEGMRFTSFYSPAPVCSPTRQALLTGLYPVRSGAYPNHSLVRPGTRSLPHHLKPLGYRTICIGKTHFGPAASYPFDRMAGMVPTPGARPAADIPKGGGEDADDGDINVGALETFIKEGGGPFCAYIAPHEPHAPWTKGDQSAYDAATVVVPPYLVDTPQTRHALATYYAEVTYLDQEVGALLQVLERTGVAAETLVLFVSEQGSSVPHAKWTLYDPGIRVAAIARWPGHVRPGTTTAALVQYVDVVPTVLAAAGADPAAIDCGCPDAAGGKGFDGRSFLDVLLGRAETLRDAVFAEHTTRGIIQGSEAYASRSVYDGRWKLIANLEANTAFHNTISDGALLASWREKGHQGDAFAAEQAERYARRPARELYDLRSDPWELSNVADLPANAAIRARLQGQLDAWMQQQGDRGDATEREAHEHQAAGRRAKTEK